MIKKLCKHIGCLLLLLILIGCVGNKDNKMLGGMEDNDSIGADRRTEEHFENESGNALESYDDSKEDDAVAIEEATLRYDSEFCERYLSVPLRILANDTGNSEDNITSLWGGLFLPGVTQATPMILFDKDLYILPTRGSMTDVDLTSPPEALILVGSGTESRETPIQGFDFGQDYQSDILQSYDIYSSFIKEWQQGPELSTKYVEIAQNGLLYQLHFTPDIIDDELLVLSMVVVRNK